MKRFWGIPTVESLQDHRNYGIAQVVLALAKHLPAFGWEYTANPQDAILHVHHGGEGEGASDVAIVHGLHPTADMPERSAIFEEINRRVIQDVIAARQVIVPSRWVADIFQRDMLLSPQVIQWGVSEGFTPGSPQGYILWNKNRQDFVCNPVWMNQLAALLPQHVLVSTFGQETHNVRIIGRQPFEKMVNWVRGASLYLATTRETGDIGSREALACGVPVVGFAQGALLDFIQHGENGYLAEPGDIEGLAKGVEYCWVHRERMSRQALYSAQTFNWEKTAQQVAHVFDLALQAKRPSPKKLSVVIPCYNYGHLVKRAVDSVLKALAHFALTTWEIIMIDDCSTDDSWQVLAGLHDGHHLFAMRQPANGGVARARNEGIKQAAGEYIFCLDADDQVSPPIFDILIEALDRDRLLGIAYTALGLEQGGQTGFPPAEVNYDLQFAGSNQIPTACLFRREDWQRVGGYRSYMQPAEDADLWTRMIGITGRKAARVSDAPLFIYNVHSGSLTSAYRQQGKADPFMERGQIGWGTHRPIAAPPPKGKISNPVSHRDMPLLYVDISQASQEVLDWLLMQSFRDWTLDDNRNAPLVLRLGQKPPSPAYDWLERALQQTLLGVKDNPDGLPMVTAYQLDKDILLGADCREEPLSRSTLQFYDGRKCDTVGVIMATCCGRTIIKQRIAPMDENDFVLVELTTGGAGLVWVGSPTGKRFDPGIPAEKAYGRRKRGDRFYVHREDWEAAPQIFKPVPLEAVPIAVASPAPPSDDAPPLVPVLEEPLEEVEPPTPPKPLAKLKGREIRHG